MRQLEAPFRPAPGLHNAHVQTLLSSIGRRAFGKRRYADFLASAKTETLSVPQADLLVDLHIQPTQAAPLVTVIPGWLGSSQSTYVQAVAAALWQRGFSVARLNLRDHGDSAHLNEGLFNSALIEEVIEAVRSLSALGTGPAGLVGFSLGGNFALRVARALPEIQTLAICPAIKPAQTMQNIDSNPMYASYFVRKWRRTWQHKQEAFPHLYDFGAVSRLSTVSALTDYFTRYFSEFGSTEEYFHAYDLSGSALQDVSAHILAAADDPIIPIDHFAKLPESLDIVITPYGGHGAYLESWKLESWVDGYVCRFFEQRLLTEHQLD